MKELPKLIALYSDIPQSGKSTVADYMEAKYDYTRVKFAGTLKAMLGTILADLVPASDTDAMIDGDKKETPIDLLGGVTPRTLMQTLGTAWGRSIDADLWVKTTMPHVRELLGDGKGVVIDDMRFANEFDAVKELGGVCVKVVRMGHHVTTNHASEGGLAGMEFNATITAPDGVDNLTAAVERWLTGEPEKWTPKVGDFVRVACNSTPATDNEVFGLGVVDEIPAGHPGWIGVRPTAELERFTDPITKTSAVYVYATDLNPLRPTVYLCGPITGDPRDVEWRETARAKLAERGIATISPLAGKDTSKISGGGIWYDGAPADTKFAGQDYASIDACDAVLCHVPYDPPRQMIGSLMEMGYAAAKGKPVVLCSDTVPFAVLASLMLHPFTANIYQVGGLHRGIDAVVREATK